MYNLKITKVEFIMKHMKFDHHLLRSKIMSEIFLQKKMFSRSWLTTHFAAFKTGHHATLCRNLCGQTAMTRPHLAMIYE